jgi:hypothetical protein
LSRSILQYILYSKNEKKLRLDFYCGKFRHSNGAIFQPAPKIVRFIGNRKKYEVAKSKGDNSKGKRCTLEQKILLLLWLKIAQSPDTWQNYHANTAYCRFLWI